MKELVNGVGSKANKPKGKDVVIGLGKSKGLTKTYGSERDRER